jgi:type II secretory pathway pseudopilin PulG
MAALLVGLSVMAVLMSMAMPVWSQFVRREREEELIWRGNQYARAIGLFQRKYANTFPPTIDILVEQRFLRKKYKDPITGEDFMPIPAGGAVNPGQMVDPRNRGQQGGAQQSAAGFVTQGAQGTQGAAPIPGTVQQPSIGIQGVVSKSKETSVKVYNGRTKYNEWAFVYLATAQRIGPGGVQAPGAPGVPGGQQMPPGALQQGGTAFTPVGGVNRRPGVGNPGFPNQPGQPNPFQPPPFGQPSPFGQQPQPPFGQPSPFGQQPSPFGQQPAPFGQPTPFGNPGRPVPPPQRPPGI